MSTFLGKKGEKNGSERCGSPTAVIKQYARRPGHKVGTDECCETSSICVRVPAGTKKIIGKDIEIG